MLLAIVIRIIACAFYFEYGAHALNTHGQLPFRLSRSMLLVSYQMFPCIEGGRGLFPTQGTQTSQTGRIWAVREKIP